MESKKILIVDDDEDILDIISFLLTDRGYQVMTLPMGDQVLQTIRQFHPDLLLMDVMLAGMDGRVICNSIKQEEETKKLPIILISASHDLAESLTQQGAPDDFLAKPFDIDVLLKKVEFQLAV